VTAADRSRHEVPVWVTVEWEMLLADLIKRRKQLGLTQVELSGRMGRSRDFVGVLESPAKTTMPNMATVMIWTKALRGGVGLWFPGQS
jgi:transcriptional regulator with XRE-family HTH domain